MKYLETKYFTFVILVNPSSNFLIESIDVTTTLSSYTTQTPEITSQTALAIIPETTSTFSGEMIDTE